LIGFFNCPSAPIYFEGEKVGSAGGNKKILGYCHQKQQDKEEIHPFEAKISGRVE